MHSKRRLYLFALVLSILLAACGGTGGSTESSQPPADSASLPDGDSPVEAEVEVVTVATEGAFPPFNYMDENGELVGFDVDVINAVNELYPEYRFEVIPVEWEAFFLGMDSGRYDIAASQIHKNASREEKYLFGEVPYLYAANAIIFKSGREDIQTMTDLHGMTVAAALGSNNTTWLEQYNEENGDPITIEYYDAEAAIICQEIVAERVDAFLNHPVLTQFIIDEQGLDLDYVIMQEFGANPVYAMFAKNENGEKFREIFDEGFQTLLDNGTLAELSLKWCGADYTTEEKTLQGA